LLLALKRGGGDSGAREKGCNTTQVDLSYREEEKKKGKKGGDSRVAFAGGGETLAAKKKKLIAVEERRSFDSAREGGNWGKGAARAAHLERREAAARLF